MKAVQFERERVDPELLERHGDHEFPFCQRGDAQKKRNFGAQPEIRNLQPAPHAGRCDFGVTRAIRFRRPPEKLSGSPVNWPIVVPSAVIESGSSLSGAVPTARRSPTSSICSVHAG